MTRRRFARMRCRRMMFPASIRIKSNRMQLAALLDCSLGSIAAARSSFFFVLIRLLSKPLTPDLLSRLQALSPDLLLRGALASSDPCNSELCFFMAVLNYDLVSNLHLASITTQLHTMVADIESMREMAILTPGDPESHWYDRFGSLRPPFAYAKSRHVPPRSLRVAVVGRVVIIVIFFAVVFLFVLFLVGRLSQENVGGCRPMRRV